MLNQSSSHDSEDLENQVAMKMQSKNAFVKLATYLRIKKLIKEFKTSEITVYDKNLILGMFSQAEKREIVEEIRQRRG